MVYKLSSLLLGMHETMHYGFLFPEFFLYIKLHKYKTSPLLLPLSPSYTHTHTQTLYIITVEPPLKRHPGLLSNRYNTLLFRTNSWKMISEECYSCLLIRVYIMKAPCRNVHMKGVLLNLSTKPS